MSGLEATGILVGFLVLVAVVVVSGWIEKRLKD